MSIGYIIFTNEYKLIVLGVVEGQRKRETASRAKKSTEKREEKVEHLYM